MIRFTKIPLHRAIRLTLLIMAFLLLKNISAQQTQKERINVQYHNQSLKEILIDLEQKTSVRFSYSAKKIPLKEKLTVSFTQATLQEILAEIFKELPVKFEMVDDYIILKKDNEQKTKEKDKSLKKITLSGYIKDAQTGEYLIGATIYVKELEVGSITNPYGYFSVTIPQGSYTLILSYIGYREKQEQIELRTNVKLDFKLNLQPHSLDEVLITSYNKKETLFEMKAAQTKIQPVFVKQQPSLMGESDVIKILEFQPGISFYGDGSSYFHVRGGNLDQNLILLDEATIYNPSHLLGIFSPIIPDAIKSVDVYKADYPVQYGGKLSSVIDIRTKDGNRQKFSASGSLGIISARATVEGPLKKGASSYFISFRRSFFDSYLKPFNKNLQKLHFYDFTTKFNIRLGSRDRLFFTLYRGEDIYRIKEDESETGGLDWSNSTGTLRWNHVFGSRVFLNTILFTSQYDYNLHESVESDKHWNSRITNASLKHELTFFATPRMKWRYGIKAGLYDFNPGNYNNPDRGEDVQVSPVSSLEMLLYAGAEQNILPWMKINYGLRFTSWSNYGESFVMQYDENHEPVEVQNIREGDQFYNEPGLEPRISTSVRIGKYSSLKAVYSRTFQFINLITNSISPFNSLEVWLPAGPNIKPQYADIIDIGFVSGFSGSKYKLKTDLFYKWMYNQIGYAYHANMLVNPHIEGEIRQGEGRSFGFEISLQKEGKRLSGEMAYTWSRSFLHIGELNEGREFPATQDKPHQFSLNLSLKLKPRWRLTMNMVRASGGRITTPTSFYYYRGYQVPVFTEQNNDRLPFYSRFDISSIFQFSPPDARYDHSLSISIYNMFGNDNPVFLYFNKTFAEDNKLIVPADRLNTSEITSSIRYTFKVFPSVSYQFSF